MGRPTKFTPELAALICSRVATNTCGLIRLCEMYDDLPTKQTINVWRHEKPEFSAQYAQAKLFQADLLAEEILDIADDSRNDWMESLDEDAQGLGWKLNGDHVNRCRLRIDTRKWLAAKLLPKQYGDPAKSDSNKVKSFIENLLNEVVE